MIGFLPKINNLIIYIEHHSKRKQKKNVMMVICVPNFSFFELRFFFYWDKNSLTVLLSKYTANQIVPFLCCVCHQCHNLSKLVTCQIQLFRVFFLFVEKDKTDSSIDVINGVQCGFSVIQNRKKAVMLLCGYLLNFD